MQYASKKSVLFRRGIIFKQRPGNRSLQYLPKCRLFSCFWWRLSVFGVLLLPYVSPLGFDYCQRKQRIDCDPRCLCRFDGRFCDLAGGNIADMIKTLDNAKTSELNLGQYQQQASVGGRKGQADYHSGELDQYRKTG